MFALLTLLTSQPEEMVELEVLVDSEQIAKVPVAKSLPPTRKGFAPNETKETPKPLTLHSPRELA
jgi:hypothetical protein